MGKKLDKILMNSLIVGGVLTLATVGFSEIFSGYGEVRVNNKNAKILYPSVIKERDKVTTAYYFKPIEEYEKKLENEIGPVPTYIDFINEFYDIEEIGRIKAKNDSVLKIKVDEIIKNPDLIKNNDHYKEFELMFQGAYDHPEKDGFLGFESDNLSGILENRGHDNGFKRYLKLSEYLAHTIDLKNPTDSDKSFLFLIYIQNEKEKRVSGMLKTLVPTSPLEYSPIE